MQDDPSRPSRPKVGLGLVMIMMMMRRRRRRRRMVKMTWEETMTDAPLPIFASENVPCRFYL